MSTVILDGHKLAWHQGRVQAWLEGERIAPITIDCSLTTSCTYSCEYCYGKLQANDEKRITRDVIVRFLDDAAEIGVKAVSFVSDGESTCSPHLYDAILHGHGQGLDMALGTNGYLLKRERLPEILPCLTYLRFNVSAGTREAYAHVMGCDESCYDQVMGTIRACVDLKRKNGWPVTVGMQMVLLPKYADQIIPLALLGKELGVDYLVIKHCSDDEDGSLGVDYSGYQCIAGTIKEAESLSTPEYQVSAKWSKILSGGKRSYSRCYGPPFLLQMSGSGLVAPCGMLFNDKYKRYHIGNIVETPFKDLWQGERYWQVMGLIASEKYDARTMCGTLCLQHKVNEYLAGLKSNACRATGMIGAAPQHVNFI